MGPRSLLKLLVLVLLVASLSACDAGTGIPASTPTPIVSTPTMPVPPEGGEIATEEPTVEDIAPTSTPEVVEEPTAEAVEEPTPEGEATTQPPTIAAQVTPPPLPPLPDGPLTIVALGDSLTEGDGDWPGEGGGYPARIQKSINDLRPGSRVINLGKSGWDSQQMLEGQLPAALEAKPHIALVWIGSNNLWYNNGPGEGETFDLNTYTDHIDTTFRSLTGAGSRVIIALLDDQTLRPYSIANYDQDFLAHMSHLVTAFNDIIRTKAAEYGATTVDFYNTTIFTDPATLSEDGIHANPAGHDQVAQIWFEAIRRLLEP
jgi:lysophospholipase L1-like esterase